MAGLTTLCLSESESCSDSPSSTSTILSHGDTDLNGEEKTCAVCGDRATGYHFHAMTCEGCKGFFRRSVIKGVQFTCPFTSSCTITKAKRRQCQACRYQKCLAAGMRKDMIMSDEALRLRRKLRDRKQKPEPSPKEEPDKGAGLTVEQEQLIEILSEAHQKNFDSSFSQFTHYQPPVRLYVHSVRPWGAQNGTCSLSPEDFLESYPEEVLPDVFSMLPIFADLSTFMIQQVIQFAKAIPAFRILPIDDQISLLKGTTLEICQIQFNTIFNEETKVWECGQHCYTVQDGALAGLQQIYLEPLLKFHVSLRKLKLHEAEYVLLQALVLFSPGWGWTGRLTRSRSSLGFDEEPSLPSLPCFCLPCLSLFKPTAFADQVDVVQREEIDQTQEKIALTLKSYIDQRHPLPEGRSLYAKLLLLLTELRTLKVENTRQILHIQDLHYMTPLLSEIIS